MGREKKVAPPIPTPPAWPMAVRIIARKGLAVYLDGVHDDGGNGKGTKSAQKLRELLAVLVQAAPRTRKATKRGLH